MQIIITDLTRFKKQDKVCTAGVTEEGTVVRPMPYLSSDRCKELDIHPGGILEGDLTGLNNPAPHNEDASYKKLNFKGACSSQQFRQALESTLYNNMSEGFGTEVTSREKCIPISAKPIRSLITIKVNPLAFTVVQDGFDATKVKAHFTDNAGVQQAFLSVTDRGFYDYAQGHADDSAKFLEMTRFIQSQDELYLRLGLSRSFQAQDGRNGYWIQLNGIYTFPNKLEYIRVYE